MAPIGANAEMVSQTVGTKDAAEGQMSKVYLVKNAIEDCLGGFVQGRILASVQDLCSHVWIADGEDLQSNEAGHSS